MKILLINNHTQHLKQLSQALAGHDVEIQQYQPSLNFHDHDKDLVILSGGGGEGLEIDDTSNQGKLWYDDEMDFVRNCQKPIIGICMGFEVMAKAYGKDVPYLDRMVYETAHITVTEKGWQLLGKHKIKQVEAHSWHLPEAPESFEVLASSDTGVEMMFDPLRRQFGTQFHPELGGSLRLQHLLASITA